MAWASQHPRVVAWIVLSVGMIALIGFEGRDVGLQATQWLALFAACIVVAGACIWIISWEDEAEAVIDTDETPEVSASTAESSNESA